MNKRIKELLPVPQHKDGPLGLYTEKEMIKFAETTVRECLTINFKLASYDEFSSEDEKLIKQIIKEYFGL